MKVVPTTHYIVSQNEFDSVFNTIMLLREIAEDDSEADRDLAEDTASLLSDIFQRMSTHI